MALTRNTLAARVRDGAGKGSARRLRAQGLHRSRRLFVARDPPQLRGHLRRGLIAERDLLLSEDGGRTWSRVALRGSNARTIAPRARAVPMAERPATPAPMTRTRAGGTVPAAVIIIGKSRPMRAARDGSNCR